jgi:hypothetical protein
VLPDVIHFIVVLLLAGTLIRIAEYLMASRGSDSPIYKFLVFAY